jgi:putative acyl-CoA dehydrogenase
VLSNTTRAQRSGDSYRLVGHKWFFSVPQSDAHLVLAQAEGGLSCFLCRVFYLTDSATVCGSNA